MSHGESCSVEVFDVKDVDPARRRKAWTDALNSYIYDYDASFPSDFMQAGFRGVASGGLRVATVSCDPMHAVRNASHIGKSGIDGYLLLMPCRGRVRLVQRSREVVAERGRIALISACEPYASFQHEPALSHVLLIPGPSLRAHKPDIDDHLGAGVPVSAMQSLFIDHASSVCRNAARLEAGDLSMAVDRLLNTLTTLLDDDAPRRRGDDGGGRRITRRRSVH